MRNYQLKKLVNLSVEIFWVKKRWKTDLDNLLGFKKTIKGKPDEVQRFTLDQNQNQINFYNSVLFHSVVLAKSDLCGCHKCGVVRTKRIQNETI